MGLGLGMLSACGWGVEKESQELVGPVGVLPGPPEDDLAALV